MRAIFAYLTALLVIVLVYAAIPFFSIPYPGEIVWTSGFAKSFINAGWPLSTKAVNFGIPAPAPIPFGLAGVFLQSGLMVLFQLKAIDAYVLGALIWLTIALLGCSALARRLGASRLEAPFFSLIYLTLPIVWWHASFAMLSIGFALLPLYLFLALRLVYDLKSGFTPQGQITILSFVLASLLAVFIDGYTYVMFVVASGSFCLIAAIRGDVRRSRLAFITAPVLFLAVILSYLAYTRYLGLHSFETAPMEVFRGWGVDVVMMLIPSQGVSWLFDAFHLSVPRSDREFFGDASVWMMTFSAPLLVLGAWSFISARRHPFAAHSLCISLIGFYFALGPSLKVNLLKPRASEAAANLRTATPWNMPKDLTRISTGNEIFSEHLPGFTSMRAAYRWSGLLFVGLFGLSVLLLKKLQERGHQGLGYFLVPIVVLLNLPDLPRQLTNSRANWKAMRQMEADLQPLNDAIGPQKKAVFFPQGNDFLVNYLAAEGKYYTYNVGGDKNIELASKSWPPEIKKFLSTSLTDTFDQDIARVLFSKAVDRVVIPYFDTLVNASEWPPSEELVSARRAKYASAIARLSQKPQFLIKEGKDYAIISLEVPL